VPHVKPVLGVLASEKKVKEADLYSAFIEVPYTQGAQGPDLQTILRFILSLS